MTFDIGLQAPRSLRISNNVDMRMKLDAPGLRLAGTNQRYGARGSLSLDRGSKLYVQGHRFDVRDGRITFDNPNRISPKLDIRAVTEYRRYASTAELDSSSTAVDGASANTAGTWRIAMHASGDTDERSCASPANRHSSSTTSSFFCR